MQSAQDIDQRAEMTDRLLQPADTQVRLLKLETPALSCAGGTEAGVHTVRRASCHVRQVHSCVADWATASHPARYLSCGSVLSTAPRGHEEHISQA